MSKETREGGGLVSTRQDDDGRHYFTARILNYGKADSHKTSWQRSTFEDSLRADPNPAASDGHDWQRVIGKVVSHANGPDGLDVDVRMSDFSVNPEAAKMFAHLRDGEIKEFSYAFERQEEAPDPDLPGVTRITKAKLLEVSPVLVASGTGTRLLSVRSDEQPVARREGQTMELRYVTVGDGDAATPTAVLAQVDQAISDLSSALDEGDLSVARDWFQKQARKIGELLYLLGMDSTSSSYWGFCSASESEVRAAVEAVEDAAVVATLARLSSRDRSYGTRR